MEPYVADLHAEAELYKVLAASVPNPPHNIFSLTVIAFLPCRFKSHFEENSRDIGKNYKNNWNIDIINDYPKTM
jgi:hypothetical protein